MSDFTRRVTEANFTDAQANLVSEMLDAAMQTGIRSAAQLLWHAGILRGTGLAVAAALGLLPPMEVAQMALGVNMDAFLDAAEKALGAEGLLREEGEGDESGAAPDGGAE